MRPGGPQAPHHLTGQARQLLRSPVRAKGREWGAGPEWGQLRFKKAYCRAATSAQTQKQAGCPATGDPGSLQSPYHPYSQRMLSDVEVGSQKQQAEAVLNPGCRAGNVDRCFLPQRTESPPQESEETRQSPVSTSSSPSQYPFPRACSVQEMV